MSENSKKALQKMGGPNSHLRVLAGIEYATNPEGPSIEQLHRDARFSKVSLRTLERWAAEDRWTERRHEFVEKWSEYARAQLGTRIAQKRIEDLQLLETLRDDALAKLSDRSDLQLQPKSWDAVVTLVSKLTSQLDEIRRQIGGEMLSSIGQPVLPTPDAEHPEYSKNDIEDAARQMLLQRQRGIVASTPEPEDEEPPLMLESGGDSETESLPTSGEGDSAGEAEPEANDGGDPASGSADNPV